MPMDGAVVALDTLEDLRAFFDEALELNIESHALLVLYSSIQQTVQAIQTSRNALVPENTRVEADEDSILEADLIVNADSAASKDYRWDEDAEAVSDLSVLQADIRTMVESHNETVAAVRKQLLEKNGAEAEDLEKELQSLQAAAEQGEVRVKARIDATQAVNNLEQEKRTLSGIVQRLETEHAALAERVARQQSLKRDVERSDASNSMISSQHSQELFRVQRLLSYLS